MIDEAAMVLKQPKSSSGIAQIEIGEPEFPVELSSIPDAPKKLYLVGKLPPSPRVAIVGSRKSDNYGLEIARSIGAGLALAGVSVVSGGAGGVDTAAIEGCLSEGGRPLAVLGTGIDIAYPAANRSLFVQVAQSGALVSEYPPKTPGLPRNFSMRNRIVSGLSDGVVIVRAAKKSGSLITAKYATKQGRVLMAVPGLANDPISAGCHHLIKKGAILVESASDVMNALSISAEQQQSLLIAENLDNINVNKEERQLLNILERGACAIDAVTEQVELAGSQVASLLMQMELKGLVVQKPGMMYCLSRQVGPIVEQKK
jgi:DNA processing protein